MTGAMSTLVIGCVLLFLSGVALGYGMGVSRGARGPYR